MVLPLCLLPLLMDSGELAQSLMTRCRSESLTFGTAESCTGGMIASLLTDMAGASTFYRGSIVCYHNDIKRDLLHIDENILQNYGAVSKETALLMARHACGQLSCDVALAVTGIAGPDGGSQKKPVGTVHLAVCDRERLHHRMEIFTGNRQDVRQSTTHLALAWVLELLT